MNKYIDADELKKVFRYTEDAEYARWTLAGILGEIDGIEAADVQQVQHGRWLHLHLDPDNITGHTKGECSICGKLRIVDNYCPNCGASMMDEVEE